MSAPKIRTPEPPPRPVPWWKPPAVGTVYWKFRGARIHEDRACPSTRLSRVPPERVTVIRSETEFCGGWFQMKGGWQYGCWDVWLVVGFADGRIRSVEPCRHCCEPRAAEIVAFPAARAGAPVVRHAWFDGEPVVPLR